MENKIITNIYRFKDIAAIFLFIAFTSVIYSNTLNVPFVLDDIEQIPDDISIRMQDLSFDSVAKALKSTRPFPKLSFAFNYYFHKYNLAGYHVINILIHIINGILIYLFFKIIFNLPIIRSNDSFHKSYEWIPFFTAFIWLVHPLQTQSVTYVVQRMNSMALMFYMLSLILYSKARLTENKKKQILFFTTCFLSGLFALGSKEMAVTLPAFILLYEWYFFQDLDIKWLKKYCILFSIIIIPIAIVAFFSFKDLYAGFISAGYAAYDFNLTQRVLTEFRVVLYYIFLIFFPHPSKLNLMHDYPLSYSLFNPVSTIISLIIIMSLIIYAFVIAKKERLLSFSILWFFGHHIVESTVLPLHLVFEHRNYLPSIFVIFLFVLLVFRYARIDWLKYIVLVLVIAICSVWTFQRNKVWGTKISLWKDCVSKSPQEFTSNLNLGKALHDKKQYDKAIYYYNKALNLKPDDFTSYINLGKLFDDKKQYHKAISYYNKALSLKPDNKKVYNNLGKIFSSLHDYKKAVPYYNKALKLDPNYFKAHNNMGDALIRLGKPQESIKYLTEALKLNPEYVSAYNNMGNALMDMGKTDKAIEYYKKALSIDPQNPETHVSLGSAYISMPDKIDNAIHHLKIALSINPNNQNAHNNMGAALISKGKKKEAIKHFKEALHINPNYKISQKNLQLLTKANKSQEEIIKELEKKLELDPTNFQTLNKLARISIKKKDYNKAILYYKKMADIKPDNPTIHYNLACLHAKQNMVEDSVMWLKKAISKGFNNWKLLKTDKDLENIRQTEFYINLVKKD